MVRATLTDEQVRRARTAAQRLHGPDRRSVPDLVSHLTGVQAQVPPAASLALRARRAGLTAAAVDRARTRDRSIVLCWAMRGTLHLIVAEDHAWLGPPETKMDPEAALKDLAVRYLRSHAPAEPADLAAWSGIAPGDARRAWRGAQDRLVEVPTERGPRWALRRPPRPAKDVVRVLP